MCKFGHGFKQGTTIIYMDNKLDMSGYVTYDQAQAIIKATTTPRDALLIKTLFFTGRRIGEIVKPFGFTPSDINYDKGYINFQIEKQNMRKRSCLRCRAKVSMIQTLCYRCGHGEFSPLPPRSPPKRLPIPVYPPLLEELKEYVVNSSLRGRPNELVFNLSARHVSRIIDKAGSIASEVNPELFPDVRIRERDKLPVVYLGKKPLHPHHFRHGFATHLSKFVGGSAEDSKQLQILMAHSDIRLTQLYIQTTPERIRKTLMRAFNVEGVNDG